MGKDTENYHRRKSDVMSSAENEKFYRRKADVMGEIYRKEADGMVEQNKHRAAIELYSAVGTWFNTLINLKIHLFLQAYLCHKIARFCAKICVKYCTFIIEFVRKGVDSQDFKGPDQLINDIHNCRLFYKTSYELIFFI